MNRDDVLRVAKECGFESNEEGLYPLGYAAFVANAGDIKRFAAAMYAAGAEAMRERAANTADARSVCSIHKFALSQLANDLRALPITPTNTEGEQGWPK